MKNDAQQQQNIQDRLAFIELDDDACASIRSIKAILDRELPVALDLFYKTIQKTPETRKFFNSQKHMDSAKGSQVDHWKSISAGNFDQRYVANVRKVGQTHARIGLEPRWYIGGYAIVVEHLINSIVTEMWPKNSMLGRPKIGPGQVSASLSALIKAMMLDMDLSISMYVEAAEEARRKLEREAAQEAERVRAEEAKREALRQSEEEAANRERTAVLTAMGAAIARVANKDLTSRINEDLPPAYRELQTEFNAAIEQVETAMQQVVAGTGGMVSGTQEISSAADDLSRRTEQQAASLEETAASLEEITTTVKKTAQESAHARDTVSSAKSAAETSRDVVRQAVDAMAEIENSSKEIAKIIGVIDEIAFQTNLLALNAGVEAARAGDAGRGFAVVASEVRALAQRSAEAAKQIKTLISRSSEQVEHGVHFVSDSGRTLEQIISHVMSINEMILSIAHAAEEQATGLAQVNVAIAELDQTTQQNAAMVEETTAACHTLGQQTDELQRIVNSFALTQHGTSALRHTADHMSRKIAPKPLRASKPAQPKLKAASGGEKADWEEF
ncbi:methyl-accepting chemotaxis protein [Hyphomicrobium sp.]|uniref:methyl-accepting chemotaxis protein n=1 Tax=Hyphomicrobium sp. TaxID=82 RepID=UPI000FA0B214|nr:methyl-accepting chemotaxis protein [Hyphomicrobium sp.]RUO98154.1 MAG: globin-coupled sensor protein [Hyphomicrobium sp.]